MSPDGLQEDPTVSLPSKSGATFPSVNIAYDLINRSYEVMLERLESVESRIQNLQTLIVTLTLAVPVFTVGILREVNFLSLWFIAGLFAFVAAMICGVAGRAYGLVTLVNPKVIYDNWLHFTEWEFKKNAIYFAGKHYEANASLVNTKGRFLTVMSLLFVLEIVLFLGGIAAQVRP
jgi:hypothetical protein